MTAIVMECLEASQHPNAESLRVYKFGCDRGDVRIVANMENIYEVGDRATIVLADCMMNDAEGTQIRVAKIRGCRSHGMALGKTDLAVNTDLTHEHCEPPPLYDEEFKGFVFKSWPSIGALANVRKDLKATSSLRTVKYRGKVKIDGTNAAVQVRPNGDICAQSRNRLLNTGHDNGGFARWVDENKNIFINARFADSEITVFGEWSGSGIQSNSAAIANIGKKVFAIFALQIEEGSLPFPLNARVVYDPKHLEQMLKGPLLDHDDVFILPWYGEEIDLDFTDSDKLKVGAGKINTMVAEVEKRDPWVADNFNVDGVGEGVVMYPINDAVDMKREDFVELIFKAKGEKHKVSQQKKPVQIDPEVQASVDEFVQFFVTENRLNQIAKEVKGDGDFDIKKTGHFVKALTADVQKESTAELEASNLEWKQAAKGVSAAAQSWWKDKANEL